MLTPPRSPPPPHTHSSSRNGPQHTQHTPLSPPGIAGCGWSRHRRFQRLPMYLTLRQIFHRLLMVCLPPQGTPTHSSRHGPQHTQHAPLPPPPVSQGVGGHCTAASTVPMRWSCRKISHRLPHPMRMISIPPRDLPTPGQREHSPQQRTAAGILIPPGIAGCGRPRHGRF